MFSSKVRTYWILATTWIMQGAAVSQIYDRIYLSVDLPEGGLFRFHDRLSRPSTSVELLFSFFKTCVYDP